MNFARPLLRWFSTLPSVSLREMFAVACVTGVAIFLTGFVADHFIEGSGLKTLLASMGASAVILFSVPNSPMAGSWPLVGGHLISGTIGIFCAEWIPETWLAAALAVGCSVLAMHGGRCLHPPGGASALIPILGGESVQSLGLQFLVLPLGLNVAAMWLTSLAYRKLYRPPHHAAPRQLPTGDVPPLERLGIRQEDLHAALHDLNAFVDVSETELNDIYNLAAARAVQREFGALTVAQIMTRELITVEFGDDLDTAWQLMHDHAVKALPVVDRGHHVVGIITLTDFFRYARADTVRGMGGGLRKLLRRTPDVTSQKPEVAGQIMSSPVVTARGDSPITDLMPILAERRLHRIPIVDSRNKLVGLVTQTDLIAALYRQLAALSASPLEIHQP